MGYYELLNILRTTVNDGEKKKEIHSAFIQVAKEEGKYFTDTSHLRDGDIEIEFLVVEGEVILYDASWEFKSSKGKVIGIHRGTLDTIFFNKDIGLYEIGNWKDKIPDNTVPCFGHGITAFIDISQ